MPYKPPRPCKVQTCSNLTHHPSRLCNKHRNRQEDGRKMHYGILYDRRWQRARRMYLREHPLCVICKKEGRDELATVIDHIISHKGNMDLFWDEENWQALCKRHHDEKTAKEDGGFGK